MKKILIVEDEQETRELLKNKLARSGYDAMTASDGQEVLTICATNHPDLVLLDIAMPGMDGYQICEKIKQDNKTKDINILFMTGKDLEAEGIIKRYEKLGCCGYISKPATFEELLAKIKEVIG